MGSSRDQKCLKGKGWVGKTVLDLVIFTSISSSQYNKVQHHGKSQITMFSSSTFSLQLARTSIFIEILWRYFLALVCLHRKRKMTGFGGLELCVVYRAYPIGGLVSDRRHLGRQVRAPCANGDA